MHMLLQAKAGTPEMETGTAKQLHDVWPSTAARSQRQNEVGN